MDEKPQQELPLKVVFNNDAIGKLTSYTYNPLAKKHVGLAYIDSAYTIDGLNLTIELEVGSGRINGDMRHPYRKR